MSTDDASDHIPPPEAQLIRARREARRISPETLSQRMKDAGYRQLSGGRLREIEKGLTRAGQPTRAPADRLVDIALNLGIGADDLTKAGREDAAALLTDHIEQRSREEPLIATLVETTGQTRELANSVLQTIITGLDEIRRSPHLTQQQKDELERSYLDQYRRSAEWVTSSLHDTLRLLGDDPPEHGER